MAPGLILALAFAGFIPASCTSRAGAPPPTVESTEIWPAHEAWDIDFYITDDGIRRARLVAGYMVRYETSDSTYLVLRGAHDPDSLADGVRVHFFDAQDEESGVLRAREVVYNEERRRFDARGGVSVVTREGKTLETEYLTWQEEEREIRTTGFVRIVTPDEEVRGYELRADEDLRTYEISRISGSATVPEE